MEWSKFDEDCRSLGMRMGEAAPRLNRKVLDEAVRHLQILVNKAMERELDWVALSQELNGKANPEFDPEYAATLLHTPETVFSPDTWAAKEFLKRIGR